MKNTGLMATMLASNILFSGVGHAGKWKIEKSKIKDFRPSDNIHCAVIEFIHSVKMNNYPDPRVECFENERNVLSANEYADDIFYESGGTSKYIIGFSNHIWGKNSIWVYSLTDGKQLLKIPNGTGLKNCLKSSGFKQNYFSENNMLISFVAKGETIKEFKAKACDGGTIDVLKMAK